MKYLDVARLFESEPAHIALLSTFQFDPNYFEKRLLCSPALSKARRIAIFMDAREWFNLVHQDVLSRRLNRRYFVVPVYRSRGVFHPKLNLLLSEGGGQVHCGSNNLTRSGCSNNLELLNALRFELEGGYDEEMHLAREAFGFFRRATQDTDGEVERIAREWLDETVAEFPWLEDLSEPEVRDVRLIHTYSGDIWEHVLKALGGDPLKRLVVMSPFYDKDAALLHRVRTQWPKCRIELLVQQGYTNLSVAELKRLGKGIQLFEVQNQKRRLHAKLLAWEAPGRTGCLVGSANFTTAAFDGRNVEACLLISGGSGLVSSLFDAELRKHKLAYDEFQPGNEDEPAGNTVAGPGLRISSAVLLATGQLRVSYAQSLKETPTVLRIAIRGAGESRQRASMKVPVRKKSVETLTLPENALADAHGTLLVSLIAESSSGRQESIPIWVIQEAHLTYEPSEGSSSTQRKIEDTGEGLLQFLNELGQREGMASVIEYLRNLNIRFHDGAGGLQGKRRFRLVMRDPFQPDTTPEWLISAKKQSNELEEAIYDFVARHEKRRLRKHASRGNVNGMENFVDIFTTIIQLLYTYYVRGVVKRGRLIGRMTDLIEIATTGKEDKNDPTDGYLYSVYDNLGGDYEVLQEACEETNFPAEIRAALLIVQKVRYVPDEKATYGPPPKRPKDVLRKWADLVRTTFEEVGIEEPARSDVKTALERYNMFSENEIATLLNEL